MSAGTTAAASSSWPSRRVGWREVTPAEFITQYRVFLSAFSSAHHVPDEYDWCDAYGICRNTLRKLRRQTGIMIGSTGSS